MKYNRNRSALYEFKQLKKRYKGGFYFSCNAINDSIIPALNLSFSKYVQCSIINKIMLLIEQQFIRISTNLALYPTFL